jgi:ribose/xylose/arabinose/galactoside ABC-type transport system permease subunit
MSLQMHAESRTLRSLLSEYGIGAAFLLEFLLFSFLSPHFATVDNLMNVTLQTSITAIIAVGMTFVILTAGIDLSVGSVVAFGGVLTTIGLRLDLPGPVAYAAGIALGLLFGVASGSLAGLFVTKLRVTPFIVTLALMTIWRGAAFVVTEGRPVWELPEGFAEIARGRLLFVPIPTIIMAVVFVLAHGILTRTRFGRYVYAVGGNREAARLAGINTDAVLMKVYVFSGVLAALSGILLASRVNSGQPNAGLMYELDVIAAVVVGGTSLFGGRGTIMGTLIGSLLIGVLRNGLNLMNVESYVQQVIVGVVILLAVMMDRLRKSA